MRKSKPSVNHQFLRPHQLREFLGLINFFRRFISHFRTLLNLSRTFSNQQTAASLSMFPPASHNLLFRKPFAVFYFRLPPQPHSGINNSTFCYQIKCQRCKIQRRTFSLFPNLSSQQPVYHVHIDLAGPLSPSNGFVYLLTCADRRTR